MTQYQRSTGKQGHTRHYFVLLLAILLVSACSSTDDPAPTSSYPPWTTAILIPLPPSLRFANHTRPDLRVSFELFEGAGCPLDEYGNRPCEADSSLAALGCHAIREPSSLLGALEPPYPIALCLIENPRDPQDSADVEWTEVGDYVYNPRGNYLYRIGGFYSHMVRYVILRDDQFVLIETEDEFRETFAPVETTEEALSYTMAVTGLLAYYGLEPNPRLKYLVDDVIEDTHVSVTRDGYLVHLYHYEVFGCGPHLTSAVEMHTTSQGVVSQVGIRPVYKDPREDTMCVD